ncbi:MAG: hypothetical protein KGL75_03645, partial [Acidobacteriota bacterium]|nr:hypothetical protein [Acidobacteriota bacterium]
MSAPQQASYLPPIEETSRRPSRFLLASALVGTLFIWSLNYIIGKITLRHIDPFTLVAFRFPVAAMVA